MLKTLTAVVCRRNFYKMWSRVIWWICTMFLRNLFSPSPAQTSISCYCLLQVSILLSVVSPATPLARFPQSSNHLLPFLTHMQFTILFFPQNCALLGYYAAGSGNSLPTFRDNLSFPSSRVKFLTLSCCHCIYFQVRLILNSNPSVFAL
jgi:hypothetical protein